jgi:hypothetical protein
MTKGSEKGTLKEWRLTFQNKHKNLQPLGATKFSLKGNEKKG